MKRIYAGIFFLIILITMAACSLVAEQGTVVINFCDMTSLYVDCPLAEFTSTDITMKLETMQGVAVDSVVFELPNQDSQGNAVYCTIDADSVAVLSDVIYGIDIPCDLSEYAGQNTQLNFIVTMSVTTPTGTTAVTADGQAEDYVET